MTKKVKSHKVVDTFYIEDEYNNVFSGSLQECEDFVAKVTDNLYGYKIVLL